MNHKPFSVLRKTMSFWRRMKNWAIARLILFKLFFSSKDSSTEETKYLLSSEKNSNSLLNALDQARSRTVKPQTVDELFDELEN